MDRIVHACMQRNNMTIVYIIIYTRKTDLHWIYNIIVIHCNELLDRCTSGYEGIHSQFQWCESLQRKMPHLYGKTSITMQHSVGSRITNHAVTNSSSLTTEAPTCRDCQQFSHNTLLEEMSDKLSLHNIMLVDLSFLLSSSIPRLKGKHWLLCRLWNNYRHI